MTEVFDWPPVFLKGYSHTRDRPVQRSEGLGGAPFYSQSEPTRRMVTADVHGIGPNLDGAAYVEALKELMDGKPPLVRMKLLPRFWFRAVRGIGLRRGRTAVRWTSGGTDLNWFADGTALNWTVGARIDGVAGNDGWPYLDCTGFLPNFVAAYPTEEFTVNGQVAMVLRTARADANGAARIYLMTALPSGEVKIGVEKTATFEIMGYPSAPQNVRGGFSYGFEFREVFEAEFAGGFTQVSPWS